MLKWNLQQTVGWKDRDDAFWERLPQLSQAAERNYTSGKPPVSAEKTLFNSWKSPYLPCRLKKQRDNIEEITDLIRMLSQNWYGIFMGPVSYIGRKWTRKIHTKKLYSFIFYLYGISFSCQSAVFKDQANTV